MQPVLLTVGALAFGLASLGAHAAPLSNVPTSGSYASARAALLKAHWKPVRQPEEGFTCSNGDERCENRPETVNCAGTGLANCIFRWKRKQMVIDLLTVGETDPQITKVECRKGC